MNKSPIIGITTYSRNEAGEFFLPGAYIDAVQLAGGIPILLPPQQTNVDRILDTVDGLVFAGGGDIDPDVYGGTHHHTIYLVDEERDEFELALAKQLLVNPLPTLGICRGMQILGVASGVQLIAHVPDIYGDAIAHRLDHPRRPIPHDIQLEPKSRLASIMGDSSVRVVSWHHQAIKTVPNDWNVAATSADGLVEAVEHSQHPWMVAVQWHPEMSPDIPGHQRLFQSLIAAATNTVNSKQ